MMIPKFYFIIILLLFASATHAKEKLVHFGHNLSSTTELLDQGKCTLGFVFAACGATDSISVGTSPWLYLDYKMASLAVRVLQSSNDIDRLAWEFRYFNTYGDNDQATITPYKMEALWVELIKSHKYSDHYTHTYNLHVNYYFVEVMPFSLRRPYATDPSPVQINLTSFHQMELVDGWFIQGEFGFLDLLNAPQHLHGGASIGRNFTSWYYYFGFTFSPTYYAMFSPENRTDIQQTWRSLGLDYTYKPAVDKYDYSIHPEINFQYFF